MSHPFDATLKDIIAQEPADFVPVFNLPRVAATVLNMDLSTVSAATDAAFGFGQPIQEIADINFQSGPDSSLAARLLLYNSALHLRYGVPVRSLAILLRPKADAGNLDGKLAYASGGTQVEFKFDVVRMWQQPVEPFLHGGSGLLPLATLCQMPEDKPLPEALREVVREIDRRLAAAKDHARAVRLMTAAFILTGMRVRKEDLASIYQGVRIMHESTAFDLAIEEGLAKGLAEGLAEGQIKGEIRLLLRLGKQRFGPPDAEVESALTSIKDLDRLERMAGALLTVSSWQELLSTP